MSSLTGRFLIGTNVPIYATQRDTRRLERFWDATRGCQTVISVQNLAEMYPNLTGPKSKPPDTPAVAREKIASIGRLHFLEVSEVSKTGMLL